MRGDDSRQSADSADSNLGLLAPPIWALVHLPSSVLYLTASPHKSALTQRPLAASYSQFRFSAGKLLELGRRGVDGDLRALRRTKNTDESYA